MNTIGVIIPCRNYERFLPECLASLKGQLEGLPSQDLRAVVVDDYSSNPYAVQAACDDTPCIHLPEPRGVGIARNIGAAFLNTDYFLFLDADDYLHQGAVDALYEELRKNHLTAFAYGDYTEFARTNGTETVDVRVRTPAWDAHLLKTQNIASYCNLWRREAFWKIGGYSNAPVAEDWVLQRDAAGAWLAGIHVNRVVFEHRLHGENKWTKDSAQYGGLKGVSEWLNQQ